MKLFTLVSSLIAIGTAAWWPASSPPATADPYASHVEALQSKVPNGFTVVEERPFVVIGDESPAAVKRRAEKTVRWAVTKLKALYFEEDPAEIIDVWLFRGTESYERWAKELFGHTPSTPYGYYSESEQALVMNIETGGGTLIHEIVHPFIHANFPDCPSWFNEGLASLYEQCAERDDRIVGLTNWRLAGLQDAIRGGDVPSFRLLTNTTTLEFYDEDPGTNYAQSRYLCYYLQERDLLTTFYRRFRRDVATDPTGHETLEAVLKVEDMDIFQADWEKWVLGLKFP
ncbi:MAG: hypothetical protein ABIK09_08075 [Pseudomonadota bacterium]